MFPVSQSRRINGTISHQLFLKRGLACSLQLLPQDLLGRCGADDRVGHGSGVVSCVR